MSRGLGHTMVAPITCSRRKVPPDRRRELRMLETPHRMAPSKRLLMSCNCILGCVGMG